MFIVKEIRKNNIFFYSYHTTSMKLKRILFLGLFSKEKSNKNACVCGGRGDGKWVFPLQMDIPLNDSSKLVFDQSIFRS